MSFLLPDSYLLLILSSFNSVQTVYTMTESGKQLFAEYLQFLENMLTQKKQDARRKNTHTVEGSLNGE